MSKRERARASGARSKVISVADRGFKVASKRQNRPAQKQRNAKRGGE